MIDASIDWQAVLGFDLERLLKSELPALDRAVYRDSRRAVRNQPNLESNRLPFNTIGVPWFSLGRFLASNEIRPGAFLHHAAGDYYVQDAGSMLALAVCQIKPGEKVCDICAAPGGKSTALLELLDGQGLLVANEIISSRVAPLRTALSRSGYANVLVMNQDIHSLSESCGSEFDCVLVDAPCSGQSMIARGKQSMSAYSTDVIEFNSARQRKIIREAALLVRPGGRLVYSTCTFSFAENEHVVQSFLEQSPGWGTIDFPELSPWASPIAKGCYRLWPHRDACAGSFAAALRKPISDLPTIENKRVRWKHWRRVKGLPSSLDIFDLAEERILAQKNDVLHLFPPDVNASWIERCLAGLPIAQSKSGRWEPLYGSSRMIRGLIGREQPVEFDDEQACQYVAGESVKIDSHESGWRLIQWSGRPLSWGKLSRQTVKNHFPKPLRQTARAK